MADVPFNSPQPNDRPWDAFAGVEAGWQNVQRNEAQKHILEQLYIQNQQKNAELSRYTQQTPGEVQQTQLKGAQAQQLNTPSSLSSYQRGMEGLWGSQEAAGREALGTVEGRTTATNMANVIKSLEGAARHLEMTAATSPMFGQAEYQRFYEALPPGIAKMFPRQFSPDTPDMIKSLSSMLTNSPEHRREMEKAKAGTDSHEKIGKNHDMTNVLIALINAKSRDDVAAFKATFTQNRQNFQQYLTEYARKKQAGQTTPQEDGMAQMIEQMMYAARAAGVAEDPRALPRELMQPPVPGQPPVQPRPVPRPLPPTQVPPPGNPVPMPTNVPSQQEVTGAGWAYEPHKYEYRKGPNGNIQRKPK